MAFSIDTGHLPILRNYEQALKHYESITPIRGSDIRPIGNRRTKGQTIHKLKNGDIAARLYQTDCVVYHQDGSISISFGGWTTLSTAEFIRCVSPFQADTKGYVGTSQGWFKVPSYDYLRILPDGKPVDPIQEYKTLLDKKKAAAARKKLKPFKQWRDVCRKLGGEFPYTATYEARMRVPAILNGDESLYPIVAGGYSLDDSLLHEVYHVEGCFIQVPVPLGIRKEGTSWE